MTRTSERVFYGFAVVALVVGVGFVVFGSLGTAMFLLAEGVMFIAIVAYSRAAAADARLRGRWELMLSLAEAQKRGLTAYEWIRAEAERDGFDVADWPIEPGEPG